VIRIRIVQQPTISDIDGISLDRFELGMEYQAGNIVASLLLPEGWAEPVPLDAPLSPSFTEGEPIDPTRVLARRPDLVRQLHRPRTERAIAADPSPRKSRR